MSVFCKFTSGVTELLLFCAWVDVKVEDIYCNTKYENLNLILIFCVTINYINLVRFVFDYQIHSAQHIDLKEKFIFKSMAQQWTKFTASAPSVHLKKNWFSKLVSPICD